ncbi:uncharacterized protein LOC142563240 [Dermacentor variabilis]|uniref:uncharacterized protein LOC142563240 n=1 Tax=Dermacentor variabilis TaxID=34621 RepID=UPI003F5B6B46
MRKELWTMHQHSLTALLAFLQCVVIHIARGDDRRPTIGEGITVNASIFYDSQYFTKFKERVNGTNITDYLTMLAHEAEQHFNNESVMIKINVSSIRKKDDWLGEYCKTF